MRKNCIIFHCLLYLVFISGLKHQHLKTNIQKLKVSTEWPKQGKKINLLYFSLVASMTISSNCSHYKHLLKKIFKCTGSNKLLRFCIDFVV